MVMPAARVPAAGSGPVREPRRRRRNDLVHPPVRAGGRGALGWALDATARGAKGAARGGTVASWGLGDRPPPGNRPGVPQLPRSRPRKLAGEPPRRQLRSTGPRQAQIRPRQRLPLPPVRAAPVEAVTAPVAAEPVTVTDDQRMGPWTADQSGRRVRWRAFSQGWTRWRCCGGDGGEHGGIDDRPTLRPHPALTHRTTRPSPGSMPTLPGMR